MMPTMLATAALAQNGPQQTGPDFGKASPFGLVVIVLLLIGVFLLVWSMNKHLRRLPKSFDDSTDRDSTDSGTADGAPDADPDVATGDPADGTKRESD